jgi:hypothetical protein
MLEMSTSTRVEREVYCANTRSFCFFLCSGLSGLLLRHQPPLLLALF